MVMFIDISVVTRLISYQFYSGGVPGIGKTQLGYVASTIEPNAISEENYRTIYQFL